MTAPEEGASISTPRTKSKGSEGSMSGLLTTPTSNKDPRDDEGTPTWRRMSDPLPPAAVMPSSLQRRYSFGPAPSPMRQGSGWEYPLSREEKKHRVMCLFEQELAQAHEAVISAALNLDANYDKGGPPQAKQCTNQDQVQSPARSCDSTTASAQMVSLESKLVSNHSRFPDRFAMIFVCFLFLGVLCAMFAFFANRSFSEAPPAKGKNGIGISGRDNFDAAGRIQDRHTRVDRPATAKYSNSTAAVLSMREQGLHYLRISDCFQAEWFFKNALRQLEEEDGLVTVLGNCSSASLGSGTPLNCDLAEKSRLMLLADHAFALVCAQKYQDGVKLIEERVHADAQKNLPPHLLNALGYSYFRMGMYPRASIAFQKALQIDLKNPIIWNNLAASKMVSGFYQDADDALYRTGDPADFNMDEYYLRIFQSNLQNLVDRVEGRQAALPSIELWWPG